MLKTPEDRSLIIRRSQRYEVVLPARFRISDEDRTNIQVSPSAPWEGEWLPASAMDISLGGVGLATPVFVPRGALIRVQLARPGVMFGEADPILDTVVRVQRVVMSDRRPAYMIGTSFTTEVDVVSDILDSLAELGEPGEPVQGAGREAP